MSFLRALHRPPLASIRCFPRRCYASTSKPAQSPQSTDNESSPDEGAKVFSKSSCEENTVLEGLAWLKDQPVVRARPDDAYPSWLWTLLQPKVLPDDGPGGKAEKRRLRMENRQRIRDTNFMKTQ